MDISRWPLERREVVRVDEDGRPVAYKVYPAKWSKRTVLDLVQAVSAILEDQEIVERLEALEEAMADDV